MSLNSLIDGSTQSSPSSSSSSTSSQAQTRPPLPTLIVTPCSPLLSDYDDQQGVPPSPPRRSSFTTSRSSKTTASRDQPFTFEKHSSSTSPLPSPKSGSRPLRSALISVLFLFFATLLILSATMCTSDRSIAFIEGKQRQLSRLGLGLGLGCGHDEFGDVSEYASTSAPVDGGDHSGDHVPKGQGEVDREDKNTTGDEGMIMSDEEWKHYTSTIGGPATTMSGEVWDIEG